MPNDLQIINYDSLMGTNESMSGTLLPSVFSSSGSKNVMMDKMGIIKPVLGFEALGGAVTASSGDSIRFTGLAAHRTQANGVFTRTLLAVVDDGVNEVEVQKSIDGGKTWSLVIDFANPSVGTVPEFASFGADLYLMNGVITPRRWDGSSLTVAGAGQPAAPTASIHSDAGALNGTYKWKLISIQADGERGRGSVASNAIQLEDGQGVLAWTADADTETVGYELYRTLGTNELFLRVAYIEGRTTVSYTDNLSDADLIQNRALEEHGDPPPEGAYFATSHKGRMWWFRTDDEPTTGWWSDPGNAASVGLAYSFIKFEDHSLQGDTLTGARGNFGEQLIVFTENAVWSVSGTGILVNAFIRDWNKERKNAQTGAVANRAIVEVPIGARYLDQGGQSVEINNRGLAYLTPLRDIRLFDGASDTIISFPIKDTLQRVNHAARRNIHAIHDPTHGHMVWFVPLDGATYPTHAIAWNYWWGVWYVWEHQYLSSSVATDAEQESSVLIVGSAIRGEFVGGQAFRYMKGIVFGNRDREATWMTKPIYGVVSIRNDLQPAQAYTKRFRWVDILFSGDTLPASWGTVSWIRGHQGDDHEAYGSKQVLLDTEHGDFETVWTSDGEQVFSSDGEELLVWRDRNQRKVKLIDDNGRYLHDTGMRLKIEMGGSSVESISLAYQLLEGPKRRLP